MKKSLLILSISALSLLVSCGNDVVTSSDSKMSEEGTSSANQPSSETKETYEKPEAQEKSIIYQKRALPTLKRGASIQLDEFFAVVPGKNEDQNATTFQAYVVKGSSEAYVGYLDGGDGDSLNLVLARPGTVVLNLLANGVYKTITLEVEENKECQDLMNALANTKNNYTAIQSKYDEDGNKQIIQRVYRSDNYIYGDAAKQGYLLSKKDDNIYSFTLDGVDAEDSALKVNMSPAGDKADYNGTFLSLDTLANSTYWQYSTIFAKNAQFKRFKYAFTASSSLTKRIFKSLFLMSSSFGSYSPYLVLASYQNNQISLLPVLVNSSGTGLSCFYEFTLSDVNTTKVKAVEDYVLAYKAPTPADVRQITSAVKYLSNLLNYSLDAKLSYIGADGKKLSSRSPYMNIFKNGASLSGVSGTVPNLTRYAGNKVITKEAFFGSRFGGSDSTGYRQGGLWSTNNSTYNYYETSEGSNVFKVEQETLEKSSSNGEAKSHPNWWSYAFMQRHVIGLSISSSQVAASFPTYDEENNTYSFTATTSAGLSLITSVIAMCYHQDITQYSNPFMSYLLPHYGKMTWSFTYADTERTTLTGMNIVVSVTLPKEKIPALDQDYTWVMDCKYTKIGTSTLDPIISTLSVPENL